LSKKQSQFVRYGRESAAALDILSSERIIRGVDPVGRCKSPFAVNGKLEQAEVKYVK